jgi:hypothetical protein
MGRAQRGLLFRSDRRGQPDMWFLPVSEGKPNGAASLVMAGDPTGGTGFPAGVSLDGFFYYAVESAGQDSPEPRSPRCVEARRGSGPMPGCGAGGS